MSETETERNEAIEIEKLIEYHESYLPELYFDIHWNDSDVCQSKENLEYQVKYIKATITALRSQSEAERKMEKIMEWCLSDQEVASTSENVGMERAQCDILNILESEP